MLGGLLGNFFGNKYDRPDQVGQDVSSRVKSKLVSSGFASDDNYARVLSDQVESTPIEGYEGGLQDPISTGYSEVQYSGDSGHLGQSTKEINMPDYGEYMYSDIGEEGRRNLGFYKKRNEEGEMQWYSPGSDWGEMGSHPEGFVDEEYIQGMREAQMQRQDSILKAIENKELGEIEGLLNPEGSVSAGPITINPGYQGYGW